MTLLYVLLVVLILIVLRHVIEQHYYRKENISKQIEIIGLLEGILKTQEDRVSSHQFERTSDEALELNKNILRTVDEIKDNLSELQKDITHIRFR